MLNFLLKTKSPFASERRQIQWGCPTADMLYINHHFVQPILPSPTRLSPPLLQFVCLMSYVCPNVCMYVRLTGSPSAGRSGRRLSDKNGNKKVVITTRP